MGPETDSPRTTRRARTLRVAIAGINYAPEATGVARYTAGLATGLRHRGHHVQVFTGFPHYPQWRTVPRRRPSRPVHEEIDGVQVTRLPHFVPSRPKHVNRGLYELSFGLRLARLDVRAFDVVLCVSPALLASAMLIVAARARSAHVPIGLIVQDLYSSGLVETGMAQGAAASAALRLESSIFRAVDGVVVIHEQSKTHVMSRMGVPEADVRLIRNWTHMQEARPFDKAAFRESQGWKSHEKVVLHSGAMGIKQGLSNVVEAARIADMSGLSVRFVLMGDGSQRSALETLATGIGCIEFRDPLPDAVFARALSSADVLLVNERPGVRDMAAPSKLTSYFRSGRPVLAATDPDSTTAYELRASAAGVRIDPGKPAKLLEAVTEMCADEERATMLGLNGLRYSNETLSEAAAINAYEGWARDLTDRGRRYGR